MYIGNFIQKSRDRVPLEAEGGAGERRSQVIEVRQDS